MAKNIDAFRRRNLKEYHKDYLVIKGKLSLDATIVSKEETNGEIYYKVRYKSADKEYRYRSSQCSIIHANDLIRGPFVLSVKEEDNWTQREYDSNALICVLKIPGESCARYIINGKELKAKDIYTPMGTIGGVYCFKNVEKGGFVGHLLRVYVNQTHTFYAAVLDNNVIHTYGTDKYTVFKKETNLFYGRDCLLFFREHGFVPKECPYKGIVELKQFAPDSKGRTSLYCFVPKNNNEAYYPLKDSCEILLRKKNHTYYYALKKGTKFLQSFEKGFELFYGESPESHFIIPNPGNDNDEKGLTHLNAEQYEILTQEQEYERNQVVLVKRKDIKTPINFNRIIVYKTVSPIPHYYYEVYYEKDGASKKAFYLDTEYELLLPNRTQPNIPVEGIIATYRGSRERDLREISRYCDDQSKDYLKIIKQNGWTDICQEKEVELEHLTTDIRASNLRAYLKEVASIEKLSVGGSSEDGTMQEENDQEEHLVSLGDKFEKLEVTDGTVLSSFLTGDKVTLPKTTNTPITIFPFGCNHSQMVAVQNALSHSLSTIQGPPGTGKTQTILNIIANLLSSKKTVEVVSNNNSAVENILEKLDSKSMGFFVAKLGKGDNKDSFIATQQPGMLDIHNDWRIEKRRRVEMRDTISKLNKLLPSLYERDNELHRLLAEYNDFLFQKNTFDAKYPHAASLIKKRTKRLLNNRSKVLLAKRIQAAPTGGPLRVWIWKLIQIVHRFILGLPKGGNIDVVLDSLCLEYEKRERDCRIEEIKSFLSENNYNEANKKLVELSMKLFKAELYERYANRERVVFDKDDLWKKPNDFLKEYPVILSTTFSAVSALSRDVRYDYVIMDEASQVDVAAGVLSLSVAKNAVIVGDEKQLPNVVTEEFKKKAEGYARQYGIKENYNYVSNSFLSSIRKTLSPPDVTLCEHYRCHPLIIEFCNREFYGGQLVVMTQGSFSDSAMILQRTVEGNHQRGKRNQRQVDEIKKRIGEWRPNKEASVGVIAPFKDQVKLINDSLPELEAATVHKFQGREKDAIIFSTVENTIGDFVADPHLLNVAVSRAKGRFVLVASAEESEDKHMKNLMDYIRYYSKGESKGDVTSIFDLLYSSYSDDLEQVLKGIPIVSMVISENLYATAISRVLKKHNLQETIHISNEYPLRYVVDFSRETDFTDDEILYGTREGTHLDFLLTNMVTHNPVLAIEVDGVRFHKEGTEQHDRRDKLKNSIMEKAGIPLKRVSTDASGLEEDLEQTLKDIGVINPPTHE